MKEANAKGAQRLRLFLSPRHPCAYLPDHGARSLFVQPEGVKGPTLCAALLEQGFRRSGEHLYRPACDPCTACIPSRIPVAAFTPRRSQRRVWQRNLEDLEIRTVPAGFSEEYFDLYRRYLAARHADGEMVDPTPEDYCRFLLGNWCPGIFLEIRQAGVLRAVAVTDVVTRGLSAVYTFFDPELAQRSLGVFCILAQIEEARRRGLPWLYLGYWVAGCRKMTYKTEYRPVQLLLGGEWRQFASSDAIPPPPLPSPAEEERPSAQ
jgi:leucyl-tRNA---protein transferase